MKPTKLFDPVTTAPVESAELTMSARSRGEIGFMFYEWNGVGTFTLQYQSRMESGGTWDVFTTMNQTTADANGLDYKAVDMFPRMRVRTSALGGGASVEVWIIEPSG